jgi:hypothetical protein
MLSWRNMRWRGRVLILLTIALAVANAQCLAYCLTQSDDGASHCHQDGKAKSGHCLLQHDLKVGSARDVAPDAVLDALVEMTEPAVNSAPRHPVELRTASPPLPFDHGTLSPLRV